MTRTFLVVVGMMTLLAGCADDSSTGKKNSNNSGDNETTEEGGCEYSSQCAWDEFCYGGECEEALGRRYDITIKSATVPTNGDYDLGGGAPDLFVQFCVDADCRYTDVVDDSFNATWNQYGSFVINEGGLVEVSLYDEDASDDDWIVGWYWEGSDALVSLIQSYGTVYELSSGGESVNIMINPAF